MERIIFRNLRDYSELSEITDKVTGKNLNKVISQRRRVFINAFIIAFALSFFWGVKNIFGISAVDPNSDFIIIEYPEAHATNQYSPVPFTHKKHYVDYDIFCRRCHHAWKLADRDNPLRCIECHKGKSISDAILLRNAFHRCCMNCHRDLKKEKKPTGPVKCKRCHIVQDNNPRRSN